MLTSWRQSHYIVLIIQLSVCNVQKIEDPQHLNINSLEAWCHFQTEFGILWPQTSLLCLFCVGTWSAYLDLKVSSVQSINWEPSFMWMEPSFLIRFLSTTELISHHLMSPNIVKVEFLISHRTKFFIKYRFGGISIFSYVRL